MLVDMIELAEGDKCIQNQKEIKLTKLVGSVIPCDPLFAARMYLFDILSSISESMAEGRRRKEGGGNGVRSNHHYFLALHICICCRVCNVKIQQDLKWDNKNTFAKNRFQGIVTGQDKKTRKIF